MKIRVDVITGFLGSGKTTWIKKLIESFIREIQSEQYGYILRIKGFILVEGDFFLLNYNQGDYQLEKTQLSKESKVAIIGESLDRDGLRKRLTKIYSNVRRNH